MLDFKHEGCGELYNLLEDPGETTSSFESQDP